MLISLGQSIDLLHRAVALKGPDHVQNQCNYLTRPNGNFLSPIRVQENADLLELAIPGCIVGVALVLAGVPRKAIHDCEGVFDTAADALRDYDVYFTDGARALLQTVQTLQDGRYNELSNLPDDFPYEHGVKAPWGFAVEQALRLA